MCAVNISFSAQCKTEMAKLPLTKICCCRAELYGCLLLGNLFMPEGIRLVTEHTGLATRLPALLYQGFGLTFDRIGQKGKLFFEITNPTSLQSILSTYGHDDSLRISHHLNRAVLEDECCHVAFLRGAFLMSGVVASPLKKYHLELPSPHIALTRELYALLAELHLPPKQTTRKGHQILYFKASELVEDFLTMTGATVSAMTIMEAKVEKDVRNQINRKVNCETANSAKTVQASLSQIDVIQSLQQLPLWEELPLPLREAGQLRLDFPEDTLSELAQRAGVGKSGMNHRLRKLMELSETQVK